MSKRYPLGKPLVVAMTEGQIKSQREFDDMMKLRAVRDKLPKVRAKRRRDVYPDDCECDARDRKTCQHNCAPLPWPASGVIVGRWSGRKYGGKLQDQVNQLANIRNAVYLHPHDFTIGKTVHWMRDRKVKSGVVVEVRDDNYQPAVVRSAGPRRYDYKPTIYAYCDAEGRKPCVCELPIGQRTECQHKPHCPVPGIDKALYGTPDVLGPPQLATIDQVKGDKRWYVRVGGLDQARFQSKGEAEVWADGWNAALGIAEPGVKLMQSHSPESLAGLTALYGEGFVGGDRLGIVTIPHNTKRGKLHIDIETRSLTDLRGTFHNAEIIPGVMVHGSLMGPDEYATLGGPDNFPDGGRPRPWQFQIAEYEVRESRKGNGLWGIYCRDYNVRLATFSPNSFALRDALARGFDAAHAKKKSEIIKFKVSKMSAEAQIAHRQKQERDANNGWYTHSCGQWVHDKLSPCSVCKPKRKPRKKK